MNSSSSIDWSSTAAWIALAIAIFVPIINSILSNRQAIKLRKLDFSLNNRIEMFSEYIDATTHELNVTGRTPQYNKMYNKIFLYVPKDLWRDIENLDAMIVSQKEDYHVVDKQQCTHLLVNIAKKFPQAN